jgi:hypothetical protein
MSRDAGPSVNPYDNEHIGLHSYSSIRNQPSAGCETFQADSWRGSRGGMALEAVNPDKPNDFEKDIAQTLKFLLKIGVMLYAPLKRAGQKVGWRWSTTVDDFICLFLLCGIYWRRLLRLTFPFFYSAQNYGHGLEFFLDHS